MRFIAKTGAPNIPIELLEAHENGKLVLFCGAGISYPAGLPGFKGLVENVYNKLGDIADSLEIEAFQKKLFDRVFELLEKRYHLPGRSEPHLVRKKLIESLSISENEELTTHKSILELSKTKNGLYRLVTTNFDRGFLIAGAKSSYIDPAPKLPIPKPHKWSSIVHLHGLIDELKDPKGQNLVVTSGDFGTAYLTERWASKFVSELFQNFTILFIGYSIDDPVIRYMTDAIAADRRENKEYFNQPYILTRTSKKKREIDKKLWEAKGVIPIFYLNDKKHSYLHKTLKIWADYSRDGLLAKEKLIKTNARLVPLPPYSEKIKQIVDILFEKTAENINNAEGFCARIFSELTPPAPIEWLPVLESSGLLGISSDSDTLLPVAKSPELAHMKIPSRISFYLWRWLTKHLETVELVDWVIKKGSGLHSQFKALVRYRIEVGNTIKEPFLTFWSLITSDSVRRMENKDEYFYRRLSKVVEFNESWLEFLKRIIQPSIKFSKSLRYPLIHSEEISPQSVFDGNVTIGLDSSLYHSLTQNVDFPNKYCSLLLDATNALKGAVELLRILGKADKFSDMSNINLKSVTPLPQKLQGNSWTNLINLNAALWQAAWEIDNQYARAVFELWKTIETPSFKRLVLFAITQSNVCSNEQALNYLLENNAWSLWSTEVRREKFRLLNILWPKLNRHLSDKLIDNILKGPPRKMYIDDLPESNWSEIFDRNIWLILSKLKSYEKNLGKKGIKKLADLSKKYTWKLQSGDRDEYSYWTETRWGYDYDMTIEELQNFSFPQLIEKIQEDCGRFREGRLDLLKSICKSNSKLATNLLKYISNEKIWDGYIWLSILSGILESEKNTWESVAPLIEACPNKLYKDQLWIISHWLEKSSKFIEADSENENLFWLIFEKIASNIKRKTQFKINNVINDAINNPLGMATEALIYRLEKRDLNLDERIKHERILSCLTNLLEQPYESNVLSRVILASRLYYFYAVDQEWTKSNLIPLMDFSKSDESKYIWAGYLRSGDVSVELATVLKDHIIGAIENVDQITEYNERLYQIFALICLDLNDLYSLELQQKVFRKISNDGKAIIADFLSGIIEGKGKESENYWNNRIKPLLVKVWPKDSTSIDERISESLSLFAIKLESSYQDVVNTVVQIIGQFKELGYFIRNLKDSNLHKTKTYTSLILLNAVFTDEFEYDTDVLKVLINEMLETTPEIKSDQKMQRLLKFLKRKGH